MKFLNESNAENRKGFVAAPLNLENIKRQALITLLKNVLRGISKHSIDNHG